MNFASTILYIKVTCLSVCLSVCPGNFRAWPGPLFVCLFFFFFVFFWGFCFLPPRVSWVITVTEKKTHQKKKKTKVRAMPGNCPDRQIDTIALIYKISTCKLIGEAWLIQYWSSWLIILVNKLLVGSYKTLVNKLIRNCWLELNCIR